ncbi:hypothetical protein [Brevibacillus sp. VP]|uniref:hypothetical protein n=1 Tax=Brevibacillus sp. JB24b TaxID=3422308 RepID=UPI0011C0248D
MGRVFRFAKEKKLRVQIKKEERLLKSLQPLDRELFDTLSATEKKNLAKQPADFFSALHQINVTELQINNDNPVERLFGRSHNLPFWLAHLADVEKLIYPLLHCNISFSLPSTLIQKPAQPVTDSV